MMDSKDIETILKVLGRGFKVYILWWNDPWYEETCDQCGNEFGIDHKELVGIYISKPKALEAMAKRCTGGPYKEDDHEIEEEKVE